MANCLYPISFFTDSTKTQNYLWSNKGFDMPLSHRPANIFIRIYFLGPLVWINLSNIQYLEYTTFNNPYKFLAISFGYIGLSVRI